MEKMIVSVRPEGRKATVRVCIMPSSRPASSAPGMLAQAAQDHHDEAAQQVGLTHDEVDAVECQSDQYPCRTGQRAGHEEGLEIYEIGVHSPTSVAARSLPATARTWRPKAVR